jgi:hypothetical protein
MNYFKLLISTIIFFISLSFYSQNKISNDTLVALGRMNFDGYGGESLDKYNCSTKYLQEIKENEIVVITGIKECISERDSENSKFYEIKYNDKYLYLEIDYLFCEKDFYSIISNLSEKEKNEFRVFSSKLADAQRLQKIQKAIDFFNNSAKQGIIVKSWKIYDESEYSEGTSVELNYINPTKKTIKYIWTTFVGYNAVDDPIIDNLKRVKNITVKSIGPIAPDESGSYVFEYMWHTDTVSTAKITNIKVQYMDGTFKIITDPSKVMVSNEILKILEIE